MHGASLLLVVLAGCSGAAAPGASAATSRTAAAEPGFADLIPAGATAISRSNAANFPIAGFLRNIFKTAGTPCWATLEARVSTGYQIEVAARHASVFVIDGDLPRDQVEACVTQVFSTAPVPFSLRREGEFTVLDGGSLGVAHAAWRGRLVVAGPKDLVLEALAGSPGNAWSARLAALPPAPLAGVSNDAIFANVLRVPTTGWDVVFDELGKVDGEARLRGHVVVHLSSASDAALAARRIADGDLWFPVEVPPPLLAGLRKLRVSVRGGDLELGFDRAMFEGVDFAVISALGERLRAVQPPR
jgi:hypothetical protein